MLSNSSNIIKENVAIYKLLYFLEVGLREFIIEKLESSYGPRWWKHRLPGDVLELYRKALDHERNIKWSQLIPHHPIYYTDFPDLRKVIERADNWKDVFKPIFKRKDILSTTLSKLEPIRNKIAHNRKATEADLDIVEGACRTIAISLGEKYFSNLVSRSTIAEDLPTIFVSLQAEAENALKLCLECRPLEQLDVWNQTNDAWWFDEIYLGCEINAIKEYFECLIVYCELPRSRGAGHKIETWMKSKDLETKYSEAEKEFSSLLDVIRGA